MSYPTIPFETKLAIIDRAINDIRNRKMTKDVAMSCSRLWWATCEVLQEAKELSLEGQVDHLVRPRCNRLVDEYQQFMHNGNDVMPHWWNGSSVQFYNERIEAVTAFRCHILAQGEQ